MTTLRLVHSREDYISIEYLEAILETIGEEQGIDDVAKLALAAHYIRRCPDVPDVSQQHIAMALGLTRNAVGMMEAAAIRKLEKRFMLAFRGEIKRDQPATERKGPGRRSPYTKAEQKRRKKRTDAEAWERRKQRDAKRREYERQAAIVADARARYLASKGAPK